MVSMEKDGKIYAWVSDFELYSDACKVKSYYEGLGYITIVDVPANDIEDQRYDGDPICEYGVWALFR